MIFDAIGSLALGEIPESDITPSKIKTWNGLEMAKVKTINGLEMAKVKSINGLV